MPEGDASQLIEHPSDNSVVRLPFPSALLLPRCEEAHLYSLLTHLAPSHNMHQAFILTRAESHWVTYNRGKSWQQFKISNATPSFMATPLSFHATERGAWTVLMRSTIMSGHMLTYTSCLRPNPGWILFQGTVCEDKKSGGWGSQKCWDEVSLSATIAKDHLLIHC